MATTTRNRLVALFGALVIVVLVAGPAGADHEEGHDCVSNCGGGGVDPDGRWIDAWTFSPGDPNSGVPIPGGSSYLADCHWSKVLEGETRDLHPIAGAWTVTFTEDNWLVWCPPQVVVYAVFPVGDPPPPTVVDDMVRDAYDRTPVVAFNPRSSPDGTDDIPLVTQVLTYLWVDEALWTPVTATASIPGVFSVTTTATPVEATWTGGDKPATVVCDQGTPYQFGVGGDAGQDQSCTTVFTHSSDTTAAAVEVSVRWDVSLTCSIPVCGGPLPPIFTNSTRAVTVAEIQAVES